MTDTVGTTSITGAKRTLLIGRFITKAVSFLAALVIVYVIQIFRLGPNNRYIFIVLGSIFSIVILFTSAAYVEGVAPFLNRHQIRNIKATLVRFIGRFSTGFGSFIPYLFGCYLFFYEGLWRVLSLIDRFSWGGVIITLAYILGGYAVVSAVYKLSEFVRSERAMVDHTQSV